MKLVIAETGVAKTQSNPLEKHSRLLSSRVFEHSNGNWSRRNDQLKYGSAISKLGCGSELIEARLDMKANREFKYLLPLDDEIADRMKPVSKPFPMRHSAATSDAPEVHPRKRRAARTVALQTTIASN